MGKFYVYVYKDPSRANEPFYIGKGKDLRYKRHLARTDRCEFVHRLQKMKRAGVLPIIEMLSTNLDDEMARLVEVEAISLFGRKDLGKGSLLNLTDGGDGVANPSYKNKEAWRNKISQTMRTNESITKQRAAQIEVSSRPEVKEKRRAAALRLAKDPVVKAKRAASQKIAQNLPSVKEKRIASYKETMSKPGASDKLKNSQREYWAQSGIKEARRQMAKDLQARPEVKEKQRQAKYKKCTVDDIIVFPSRHELIKTLGQGKAGLKNPNFKYII